METMENTENTESSGLKKFGAFGSEQLTSWLAMMFALAVSIIITVFTFYIINFDDGLSGENGAWGTFGDFFGGTLNPILSFISLTALLLTVVLQSRQAEISQNELKLSREELAATRNELARSASAQERAEKLQAKQFFETTFFNLLELHHKLASELKFDAHEMISKININEQHIFNGSAALRKGVFEGRLAFDGVVNFISHGCKSHPKVVLNRYKLIQKEGNDALGHYFRNIYQILKFINRYNCDDDSNKEKTGYASIFRSQLSTKEQALLFLNCLYGVSDNGKFRNLLIEFKILEHLPIQKLKLSEDEKFEIIGAFQVDKSMVLEYERIKEIPQTDLDKYYGGAFGKNRGVPYDLATSARADNGAALSTYANGG